MLYKHWDAFSREAIVRCEDVQLGHKYNLQLGAVNFYELRLEMPHHSSRHFNAAKSVFKVGIDIQC